MICRATTDAVDEDHSGTNFHIIRIFRDNGCMNNQDYPSGVRSALLSFSARNVRSYREAVHLSLLATRLSDTDVVRDVDTAGASSPVSVLPVAGIFGANASGKSTALRAMADMRAIVLGSFRHGDHETRMRRYWIQRSFDRRSTAAARPYSTERMACHTCSHGG